MSKMSIEWHENCLKNRREFLKKTLGDLKILRKSVSNQMKDSIRYGHQIITAKKAGKCSFDKESYLQQKTK